MKYVYTNMSFESTLTHPLDAFQMEGVKSMNSNHSIMVAAPTGSGKTIFAEYSWYLSREAGTKMIYSAPLKAISNQKFNDFKKKFGEDNVGIITGDVVVNENADLLIMTTEILRALVFSHDGRLNNVKWVVFDEIHYINDPSRGSVYEETLILMPNDMRAVFLSATVPNANEFATWFGGLKNHQVDVIFTTKRPVPLSFHVISNNEIKDIAEFDKIKSDSPTVIDKKLVKLLQDNQMTPSIFFSCNKIRIEALANRLSKEGDIVTVYESKNIKKTFEDLLRKYKIPEEYTFHQKYMGYAVEGIAVHHAGMPPYVKEIIEMLFCKGMLPILISTETFAVGVNSPVRSVVFESLHKFDGSEHRLFKESEFVQMAGRAGRRGFDTEGSVFVLYDPTVPKNMMAKLIVGKPEALRSSLKMSAGFVLRCMQRNIDIEDVIKCTFDSFVVFKPTDTELAQARLFETKRVLWKKLLSRVDIWKFVKVGMKCTMIDGTLGIFLEVSSNGAYKVILIDDSVDDSISSSGVAEIDMKLNMKIKNFDSALILSKLKKIGQVERPEKYDDIMEYIILSNIDAGLLGDFQEYKKWLESENLCRSTLLTPLGEIAACIGSICPALGSKLLSDDIQDEDIVAAVATFSAARDNSSSGKSFKIPFADYCPFSLDFDLVSGVNKWFAGGSIEDICKAGNMFEGNLISCITQTRNAIAELITAGGPNEKLQSIHDKLNRGVISFGSLYL
jgi:superfamily II RNA helicase